MKPSCSNLMYDVIVKMKLCSRYILNNVSIIIQVTKGADKVTKFMAFFYGELGCMKFKKRIPYRSGRLDFM